MEVGVLVGGDLDGLGLRLGNRELPLRGLTKLYVVLSVVEEGLLGLAPLRCEPDFDDRIIENALTVFRDSAHLWCEVLLVTLPLFFRRGDLYILEHAVVLHCFALIWVNAESSRIVGPVHTLEDLVVLYRQFFMIKAFELGRVFSSIDGSLVDHGRYHLLRASKRLAQGGPTSHLLLPGRSFLEAEDVVAEQLLRDCFITALPLGPCAEALTTRLADVLYGLVHRLVDRGPFRRYLRSEFATGSNRRGSLG